MSRLELSEYLGQKKVSGQLNKIIQKLISDKLVERTIPDVPNHPAQKFVLTRKGIAFLAIIKNECQ